MPPVATPAQTSFLPNLLLRRLEVSPPIRDFEVSSAFGALVLSDIHQFTSLVERYSNSGQAGLEKLTWLLHRYFKTLVEVVVSHGGDVLYVAGDSFLCHWPMDYASDTDPVLRAAKCALDIHKALRAHVDDNNDLISTRIGVSCGGLLVSYLGGHRGRWELVVSGAAFDEVLTAEAESKVGSVMLSPAAWAQVQDYCSGVETASGCAVLQQVRSGMDLLPRHRIRIADDVDLDPYIPPAVLGRLEMPESEWMAESRIVCVVMAALPLVTASPDSQRDADRNIEAFQQIVERVEGTLKVDIDSKGILLLAVFGLPPKAHENDAERATWCAQLLAEAIGKHTRSGFGVAMGRAICGPFGSEVRRDYMLRGEVINRAARLMQAAGQGSVLCDTLIRRSAAGRIAFAARGEVQVKGLAEPLAVFEPSTRLEFRGNAGLIVGRRSEIDQIIRSLEARDTSEIIVVEGEAGLGKSHLLSFATRVAEERGLGVLRVAADPIDKSGSYHAWRAVFMDLLDVNPAMNSAEMQVGVEHTMNNVGELYKLLPLLSDVLPLDLPDNDTTSRMVGDVRAANMQRLLVGLMRKRRQAQPLMLAIEDLHWFDSGSWALLHAAMSSIDFEFSILTTRPVGAPLPDNFQRLYAMATTRRIRLSGLAADETAQLLARKLGIGTVPARLAAFIHGRVSGHPFFAEELLNTLLERGLVRIEAGKCEVLELANSNIPTTIEQVIVSRLDALPPGEQMCLKVASVIGNIFPCRLVEQAYPISSERSLVRSRLSNAMSANLIDLESPEPHLQYIFRHSITCDVTYNTMPGTQRRPLHREVARALEAGKDDHVTLYPTLAHHWMEAADGPKALFYLEKAGSQAMRDGAFREAVAFLANAAELMRTGAVKDAPDRKALWEKDMGIACYYMGDMDASRQHLELALARLHRPVPASSGKTLWALAKEAFRLTLHGYFPSRYKGVRAQEKQLLDEAVQCYKQLGQAYYMEGEAPARLLYVTLSGLNLGEEAGDSAALARVTINAAVLFYVIGKHRSAERFAASAIAMAAKPDCREAQGYVWHLRALLYAQQAKWRQLREVSDQALHIAVEQCDRALESEVRLVRSASARCAGNFPFAATAWLQAREVAERIGDLRLKARSLLDEVECRLVNDETEAAASALEEALAIPTPATDREFDIEKRRSIACVRLRQGRTDEALREAAHVFDYILKNPPTGYHMADHLAAVTEIYLECAGTRPANPAHGDLRQRSTKGVKLLTKYANTFVNVTPRAHLLKAMHAKRWGSARTALGQLTLAREKANELEMPFDMARAMLEAARQGAEDADVLLRAARAEFLALNAGYFAKQCAANIDVGLTPCSAAED